MPAARHQRFTLVTLGRHTLLTPEGVETESLAKRRQKLAVLAILALSRRPVSRATLVEMFWGEQDEARARHSLSDALSHLRRVLGRSAITTHDADVALNPEAPLAVDALLFAAAADARDLAQAARLYTGSFLQGVEVDAGSSFEHWVTRERRRLEAAFLDVCAQQCLLHARTREWDQCAALAARWLEAAPLSADAALFRLNALKAPGTREAAQRALGEFEELAARLRRDFDLRPEKPVRQLADSIAERLLAVTSATHVAVRVPPRGASIVRPGGNEHSAGPTPPPAPRAARPNADSGGASGTVGTLHPHPDGAAPGPKPAAGRRLRWVMTGGMAALALVVASAATDRATATGSAVRPRVAVLVDVPSGDSAIAWLGDGLPQMVASALARSPDVDVVSPAQVHSLLLRRGTGEVRNATPAEIADVGRRLGASLIVNGTVGRDDRSLVLDLTVRDARTGRLLRTDALSRADAVSLADEAAARVLAAVNAERPGLHIADLETSSVDAYEHFTRAIQDMAEGRTDETLRHLDAAIALDSGFVSAVHVRLDIALARDEPVVADRLRDVLSRSGSRGTEFDRLRSETYAALFDGEGERSEVLGRQLVRRYPSDPRAYAMLHDVLSLRGRFADAADMWERRLSLDSLTMEAGTGPCTPCGAYGALARLRMQQGKWADAERAARRWVALQPDIPASWAMLATLLTYTQRDSEALTAIDRALSISGGDAGIRDQAGRILLMARRYDTVDSLAAAWMKSDVDDLRWSAHDLRVLLLRERGQYRASNLALDQMVAEVPNTAAAGVALVRGSNLGRSGDYVGATLAYERSVHGPRLEPVRFPPTGRAARGFCWHHALLADAIAPSGDTLRLRAIADSLRVGCARSYFGRDHLLYHHVLGLLAMQQGRWVDAEQELRQARWGVAEAWTRTNVALATTQLELGRPRDAIATLRDAYAAPLDAMGRYQPRSELDYFMARAFRAAGEADSATVYERYARRAWRDADPEVARLLLPPDGSPPTIARGP